MPSVWHDLYDFGMWASALACFLRVWYVGLQSGMIFMIFVYGPSVWHDLYDFGT